MQNRRQLSHYLNQWWPNLQMHICIIWPQRVNSLRPNEAIWRQRSGSSLAQVMACCLTAPSHYLNQYWLIMNLMLWHPPENNFIGISQNINSTNEFENYNFKITTVSPRVQWVNDTVWWNTRSNTSTGVAAIDKNVAVSLLVHVPYLWQ